MKLNLKSNKTIKQQVYSLTKGMNLKKYLGNIFGTFLLDDQKFYDPPFIILIMPMNL